MRVGMNPEFIATQKCKIVGLDRDALDLIKADLIALAIVELCSPRRGVVRHCRSFFQGATGSDAGRPETVITEFRGDAGCRRAPTDHRIGVRLRQHGARQRAGAAADRAEQRPLGIAAQASAVR